MLKQKHKGTYNQLSAELWLLGQGYEVFRNVSDHGPIDLVAIRLGDPILLLDSRSRTSNVATNEQKELNVKFICASEDGFTIVEPVKLRTYTCEQCGKTVHGGKLRRFCSAKCRFDSTKKTVDKLIKCIGCGKTIRTRSPWRKKWCSTYCQQRHYVPLKKREYEKNI